MERQGDGGGGKFRRHQWSATARDALLVVLSVVGGSVDAMVYLGVAQVFPANMTGNTALLGIALSQAHWADLLAGGVALAGFIVGIAAGAAIVDRSRDDALWPSVVTAAVALECAALIAFALEWNLVFAELDGAAVYLLIATAAVAMGLQAAAVRRLGVPSITATFVTGTLASLVTRLVRRIRMAIVPNAEPTGRASTRELLQPASVLLAYAAGASLGSFLVLRWGSSASVLPAVLVTAVAATAAILYRRS